MRPLAWRISEILLDGRLYLAAANRPSLLAQDAHLRPGHGYGIAQEAGQAPEEQHLFMRSSKPLQGATKESVNGLIWKYACPTASTPVTSLTRSMRQSRSGSTAVLASHGLSIPEKVFSGLELNEFNGVAL